MTTQWARYVHCTHCHPDGGDIERDDFQAIALERMDQDGEIRLPQCPNCGSEMTGHSLWRNGHTEDSWTPED